MQLDLNEGEVLLLRQGLEGFLAKKQEALKTLNEAGLAPGGRPFEPRDFGLPQIERLIEKIDQLDE